MDFTQNLFNRFESTTIFKRDMNKKLPVTLISGPLGSGKSTIVRHALAHRENLRLCVAVNDYARVNVDEAALRAYSRGDDLCCSPSSSSSSCGATSCGATSSTAHDHQHCDEHEHGSRRDSSPNDAVLALSDGCICCTLMGSFRETIARIIHSDAAFDYALVETSGVTDPATVIAALEEQFGKMYRARLDQVVTVIDASLLFFDASARDIAEARVSLAALDAVTYAQLRAADLIVLNKCDLIDERQRDAAQRWLAELNPLARIRTTRYCDVPLHELLDVVVANTSQGDAGVLSHEAARAARLYAPSAVGGALRVARERLDHILTTTTPPTTTSHVTSEQRTFACDVDPSLDLARFADFLCALPACAVRGKGVVRFRDDDDENDDNDDGAVQQTHRDWSTRVFEFHLSGRGRHVDIDFSSVRHVDAPRVQLAFIALGVDAMQLDVAKLTRELEQCTVIDKGYYYYFVSIFRRNFIIFSSSFSELIEIYIFFVNTANYDVSHDEALRCLTLVQGDARFEAKLVRFIYLKHQL